MIRLGNPAQEAKAPGTRILPLVAFASFLCHSSPAVAQIQGSGGAKVNSRELLNYLHTSLFETGVYEVGDESAVRLQLKLTYKPFKLDDDTDWGVTLELPVSVGVHAFRILEELFEEEGFRFKTEHLGVVSVKPTIRFPLRYHPGWQITPWQEFAANTDANDVRVFWVSTTGLDDRHFLENMGYLDEIALLFRYGTYMSENELSDDDYFSTSIRITLRRPFGRIEKYTPVARVTAKVGYYWDALTFDEAAGGTIEVREEYEIGVQFETRPRARILGIGLPRPEILVRWGDDLTEIKLKL